MSSDHLTIGFVRRGYSPSGGAESYLKRLACGVVESGHEARLFTAADWPPNEWKFGPMTKISGASAARFANEFAHIRPRSNCDVIMSLERIRACDVYRAGDGVHRAWLERQAAFATPLRNFARRFNGKNRVALDLEKSLFAERRAGRVIANSKMVKNEIARFYDYPTNQIDVVHNGVPAQLFRAARENRERTRAELGLNSDDIAALFVGSGWERKGLRFAIDAVETCGPKMRLIVAGRGDQRRFRSRAAQFLGVVSDTRSLYGAADIFLLPTIYDPFSNACLEALAAGLPVITTTSNGFSEIIEDGLHGSVIRDPREKLELRDALLFWSEPTRREAACARNVELAARFDISANVARTLEILI